MYIWKGSSQWYHFNFHVLLFVEKINVDFEHEKNRTSRVTDGPCHYMWTPLSFQTPRSTLQLYRVWILSQAYKSGYVIKSWITGEETEAQVICMNYLSNVPQQVRHRYDSSRWLFAIKVHVVYTASSLPWNIKSKTWVREWVSMDLRDILSPPFPAQVRICKL